MTASARAALLNIGTRRQGSTVSPLEKAVVAELQRLGLVGPKGGLTGRGSVEREKLYLAVLKERFGD